jgi:hypothetical protein
MIKKAASKRERRTAPARPQRLRLRVTLRHITPAIWREIIVPDAYSLLQLHRCIQLVFGWLDYHLFEFQIGPRRFEAAESEAQGERADLVRLRDLGLSPATSFTYVYDMGDYWEHEVEVREVVSTPVTSESDPCAYLVDGARAAPPEDVGGPPGYDQALAALAKGIGGDVGDLIAWLGPGFNPDLFDLRAGNHALVLATAWGVVQRTAEADNGVIEL